MRGFVGFGLAIALIALVPAVPALAQSSGQLCITVTMVNGQPAPTDSMALVAAIADRTATITSWDAPSACIGAGSATPAPVGGGSPFFTLSGTGSKTSAPFAAPGQWQLQYTYDCSSFGGRGNFQVYLYNGSDISGIPVNELGASGSSTSYVYEGGPAMHIEVNSECEWSITATP